MPLPIGSQSNVIEKRARWFVAPQSGGGLANAAYPVGAAPTDTTGGPVRVLVGSSIEHSQARELHGQTKQGARAFVGETYSAMRDTPFTIKARSVPPENLAGTVMPELHHLLRQVCGARTISAGTQIQYAPANIIRPTPLTIARLANENDAIFGEWGIDAVVNSWTLRWAGGAPPEHEFSGKIANYVAAAITTVNGAVTSSTSVTVSGASVINVGGRVQFGSDDNGGSGYLVSAIDAAGTGLTLATAVTVSDGAVVRPFMPAPTYTSQPPLGMVTGAVTIGGAQTPMTALEFTVDNQIQYIEDELGSAAFSDAVPGEQMIGGTLTLRATEQEVRRLVASQQFATAALVVSLGDGSTNRNHVLSVPQAEFNVSSIQPADVSTTQVQFRALDSTDDAADAFTFTMS